MAHKTLINGTAYEITGGKTLVGGTAYEITSGKTLVGGTVFEISFGPKLIAFTIRFLNGKIKTYSAEEGMTWAEFVNSEYNVDGLIAYRAGGYSWIMTSDYAEVVQMTNNIDVAIEDPIENGYAYSTIYT